MKTGFNQLQQASESTHKMAIITGATAVFMKHLCQDMIKLHMLTGDNDMPQIAQLCAARILRSQKCADIEAIVDAVIAHSDGMPVIENTELLSEIMERYTETTGAERNGNAKQFRAQTLIPDIVNTAATQMLPSEDEALRFLDSINSQKSFEPSSHFQRIVCNAINIMPQQMTWT